MDILYLSPSVIPSLEANSIHVMKMCQAFSQLGHNVELVAKDKPAPVVVQNLQQHYGIEESFKISRLKASKVAKEYDYGVRAAMYAMRQPVDLVLSRNLLAAGLLAVLGKPIIAEIHGEITGPVNRLGFYLLGKGRGLKKLVVITRSLADFILQGQLNSQLREKLLVCPDGVDLERFENLPDQRSLRDKYAIDDQSFVIGYSGHLYEGRGIDLILEAACSFPSDRFLIFGGDPEGVNKYREIAHHKNLTNVTFCGFIPNSELPAHLSLCSILLMPYQRKVITSRGANTVSWMSPLKMFEYMASGRLILSSDLPVLREILNEGNCIFCDPGDVQSWINAIQYARENPQIVRRIASQAMMDVRKYTWKERVKSILAGISSYPHETHEPLL